MDTTALIVFIVQLLRLYSWVLIIRILMSWLPNINWYNQPWRTLSLLTDPVMEPFRRLIPPLGGIDFSPILLFVLLNFIISALISMVR
jgi:YggT family protein